MKVIYTGESHELESTLPKIFLAGPSPRPGVLKPSWRPEAIKILKELGFDGIVYDPEYSTGGFFDATDEDAYLAQGEWEDTGLEAADCIVFWVPTDSKEYLGLTTRIEFGEHYDCARTSEGKKRVVYGRPKYAWRTKAFDRKWKKETGGEPCQYLFDTLHRALLELEWAGRWMNPDGSVHAKLSPDDADVVRE